MAIKTKVFYNYLNENFALSLNSYTKIDFLSFKNFFQLYDELNFFL